MVNAFGGDYPRTPNRWFGTSSQGARILGPLHVQEDEVALVGPRGHIQFCRDGIRSFPNPRSDQQDVLRWDSVAEVKINLPVEPRWAWFVLGTLNAITNPGYLEHGSWQVEAEVVDPWENVTCMQLGRPAGNFGRSVGVVLDEMLLTLGRGRALPALSSATFVRELLAHLPEERPRGAKNCRAIARAATDATVSEWTIGIQNAPYRFPSWPQNNADRRTWHA